MAEYRLVELTRDAKDRGLSSTYNYDGIRYYLNGSNILNVRAEIASGWISADANVKQAAADTE